MSELAHAYLWATGLTVNIAFGLLVLVVLAVNLWEAFLILRMRWLRKRGRWRDFR